MYIDASLHTFRAHSRAQAQIGMNCSGCSLRYRGSNMWGVVFSLFSCLFAVPTILSENHDINLKVWHHEFATLKVLVTGFEPFLNYDVNPSGDVAKAISGTCIDYSFLRRKVVTELQICFDGIVLPVNSTGASVVADMLTSGQPFPYSAIVHLGLEDVAKGLKLETFAINQMAEYDEDVPHANFCYNNSDFDMPTGPPAVLDAACEMPVTADLGRLTLEESLSYSLSAACRRALTSTQTDGGEKVTDPSSPRYDACGDVVRYIEGSPRLDPVLKRIWAKWLLEAWSRNAGTYYCNETLFRTLHAIRRNRIRWADGSALLAAMFVHLPSYEYMELEEMTYLIQNIGAQLASYSM